MRVVGQIMAVSVEDYGGAVHGLLVKWTVVEWSGVSEQITIDHSLPV